jgi:hypothetical protein
VSITARHQLLRDLLLRPEQRLLVLLLRLVGAAIEDVQGQARQPRPVRGAAVPQVSVHDDHVPGPAGHEHLVRVRALRIVQRLLHTQ